MTYLGGWISPCESQSIPGHDQELAHMFEFRIAHTDLYSLHLRIGSRVEVTKPRTGNPLPYKPPFLFRLFYLLHSPIFTHHG